MSWFRRKRPAQSAKLPSGHEACQILIQNLLDQIADLRAEKADLHEQLVAMHKQGIEEFRRALKFREGAGQAEIERRRAEVIDQGDDLGEIETGEVPEEFGGGQPHPVEPEPRWRQRQTGTEPLSET